MNTPFTKNSVCEAVGVRGFSGDDSSGHRKQNELDTIRNKIERMPKDRHIQCLNILVKYQAITINEPKYGNVNINLSCIPKEALDDLTKFISYVEDQENSLLFAEEKKKLYQDSFFNSEIETFQQAGLS
jgi:hypothetical protein